MTRASCGFLAALISIALTTLPSIDQAVAAGPAQQSEAPTASLSVQRGTDESPLVVRVLPAAKSREELAADHDERSEKESIDRQTVDLNKQLVSLGREQLVIFILQLVVFALQLVAFAFQAKRLRETVEAAAQQSHDTQLAIEQATRSAVAMEKIAVATVQNGERATQAFRAQLRAYVTVQLGAIVPQNPVDNWKFDIRMLLTNGGNSPALGVSVTMRLAILPVPLPQDFDPSLLPESQPSGDIGPHQTVFSRQWLDRLLSDDEVKRIKKHDGIAMYAYGLVQYHDVFGPEQRRVRFCQLINWDVKDIPSTVNVGPHNDAT